jgi:predicted short-subunit dehydrogenase-like oxidoreductase (DUF2520 family)
MFKGAICVVGRGRWGSSMLAALRSRGVAACAADPRRARTNPGWVNAEIFWLCVPDARIPPATRQIVKQVERAGGSMQRRVVLHSSGVYGSEILKDALEAGAAVASVHPLMSFPTRKPVALDGVPFAVEAHGRLRMKLFALIRELGGAPFAIRAEGKALYHAAAVMASPLLVSLATAAVESARAGGLSEREAKSLLQPIMTATLANFFSQGGPKSFSGPFARGDAKTLSLHLAALALHPELDRIYRGLALHALDVLPVKHRNGLKRRLKVFS